MQNRLWVGLFCGVLLLAGVVQAGTANKPEIMDDPTDSIIWEPQVVPHLEITKAWIQPKGDDFHFVIEVAGMPALEDIPKDAVYVWHYSWESARFYWRANWTADGSAFEFQGGIYQGCKPPVCPSHDVEGHRKYAYFKGNSSQKERVGGYVEGGNPGRIAWTYPLDAYGEDRRGLTFNGLFVTTYKQVEVEGGKPDLRYVDIGRAAEDVDYEHKFFTPWWAKFTPGPGPLLVVAAAAVVLGVWRNGGRRPL